MSCRFLAAVACLLALVVGAQGAFAAKKAEKALPYLGPGAEKLSPQDYERVYKNYIQTSILLGYPFLKEEAPACEHALSVIFRGAGMFGFPVPNEAQQIERTSFKVEPYKLENYTLGGVLLQLARKSSNNALDHLVVVNSASPKAFRHLVTVAKKDLLLLERDPVTSLERVRGSKETMKGIPVGYPSPFLTKEGQGLYVKVLRFNGKLDGCAPLGFEDNSWVGGFDLSDRRCTDLQTDAQNVWDEKLSPEEFSQRELKRMKEMALKNAVAQGTKEAEAKALIEKHFQPPFTSEINVVGSAMRNLAQCNLLALGKAGGPKRGGGQAAPAPSQPGGAGGNGAGSAQ